MEIKTKKFIVLIISLLFLMNNPVFGQVIKLNTIYVELHKETTQKDTIYYPYEIAYEMSIINDYLYQGFYKEHLIFGVSHYPGFETKNGIFRININGQIFDLINRGFTLQLVLYGDTLSIMSELHNKIFLSMSFRKGFDIEIFKQSLKDVKIIYHPIVQDYSCNVGGTYFIREDYDVIIDEPDIIITNEWILK